MDRRQEPRRSYTCRVEVTWEQSGELQRQFGFMHDRSPSGAGITLLHPIAPGTAVSLILNREPLKAIVRNCRRQGLEHSIGLELIAVVAPA